MSENHFPCIQDRDSLASLPVLTCMDILCKASLFYISNPVYPYTPPLLSLNKYDMREVKPPSQLLIRIFYVNNLSFARSNDLSLHNPLILHFLQLQTKLISSSRSKLSMVFYTFLQYFLSLPLSAPF